MSEGTKKGWNEDAEKRWAEAKALLEADDVAGFTERHRATEAMPGIRFPPMRDEDVESLFHQMRYSESEISLPKREASQKWLAERNIRGIKVGDPLPRRNAN